MNIRKLLDWRKLLIYSHRWLGIGMGVMSVVWFISGMVLPEIGYRACLGIMRLGKTYSNERLEAASKRALELNACSYQSLKSILKRSLDRQTALALEPERSGPRHENIRGAQYFNPPTNLLQ